MSKLIKIIYFIFLSFHFLFLQAFYAQEKIKIGLLVPMTGENKEIGESIIKAVGLAVKDIDNNLIEIFKSIRWRYHSYSSIIECTYTNIPIQFNC